MIGFVPTKTNRQPIYREQVSGKIGYVEHAEQSIFFCDASGRRIARVLRYKPCQAPQPVVSLCGGSFPPPGYRPE